jgi:hypothetical protein
VIATPRIDSLRARLLELESSGGYVTLDDGTKFRPKDSGIRMLFDATKLRRDLGRDPELSDFPGDDQKKWRSYAKWSPDPAQHGQISILLVSMAKKIAGVD